MTPGPGLEVPYGEEGAAWRAEETGPCLLLSKLWAGEIMGKLGGDQTKIMPVTLSLLESLELKTEGWTEGETQRGGKDRQQKDPSS